MRIVVEAGGTKCKWGLIDSKLQTIETQGFNPNSSDVAALTAMAESVSAKAADSVGSVIYFGAGCSNSANKKAVGEALATVFKCDDVQVFTDLEGAAIALFGKQKGIAAILGTGASAGYFNGEKIENQSPSLGYLLGDEGSGAYLGKMLVSKVLRKELPKEICDSFYDFAKTDSANLIRSIYSSPRTNEYLASFVPFISANIGKENIANMVIKSFQLFDKKHIVPIHQVEMPIGFVGGIAFQFGNILRDFYTSKGISIRILKDAFTRLTAL